MMQHRTRHALRISLTFGPTSPWLSRWADARTCVEVAAAFLSCFVLVCCETVHGCFTRAPLCEGTGQGALRLAPPDDNRLPCSTAPMLSHVGVRAFRQLFASHKTRSVCRRRKRAGI